MACAGGPDLKRLKLFLDREKPNTTKVGASHMLLSLPEANFLNLFQAIRKAQKAKQSIEDPGNPV